MPGCFRCSPTLHHSLVSGKWVKDFCVTAMCRRPETLQLVLLGDGSILLYMQAFFCCCLYAFPKANSTVAFSWVYGFCHSNACMCIGKSAENSEELFLRRPDEGSLWGIETLLSLWVEASPGWHLVEGECCLVGEGVCGRCLQGVPHLKMS